MAFQGDGNPENTPIEPQGRDKGREGSPMALAHAGRDGLGEGGVLVVVLIAVGMKCPWAGSPVPRETHPRVGACTYI